METWSSCIADDGMESAEAGTASRFISLTSAACVYCAIISPESTPASSARNGGRPCERFLSSSRSVRRSAMEPRSAATMARKSRTYATGAPWKLPLDSTRPSGSTTGLSTADGQLTVGHDPRVREGVAAGARHLRGAAHRVRVLDPGRVVLVVPGEARTREHPQHVVGAGALAGVRADGVQLGGEDLVGAEQRLQGQRGGDVGGGVEPLRGRRGP